MTTPRTHECTTLFYATIFRTIYILWCALSFNKTNTLTYRYFPLMEMCVCHFVRYLIECDIPAACSVHWIVIDYVFQYILFPILEHDQFRLNLNDVRSMCPVSSLQCPGFSKKNSLASAQIAYGSRYPGFPRNSNCHLVVSPA